MKRLVTTEVARWFARRLLWVAGAATIALMVLGPVGAFTGSRAPSPAEIAEAQQWLDEWEAPSQADVDTCLADQEKEREAQGDPTIDFGCVWEEPSLENYLPWRQYWDTDASATLWGSVTFLALASLLAGASFVAAEFATGSIGNWLTFAPRRGRVLASKLVATVVGFAPTAVLAVGVLVGGTWTAFAANDALRNPQVPQGPGGEYFGFTVADAVGTGGRAVVLALAFAVLGAALAFLLRHTAAVLGAVLGWAVVVELIAASQFPGLKSWQLQTNIDAWVRDGTAWYEERCAFDAEVGEQVCTSITHVVSLGHGAAVLGGVVIVVVALAAVVFRRRDVS